MLHFDVDANVRASYPAHIAHAWVRYSVATSDQQRIEQLRSLSEIVARTLLALLLADWLAHDPGTDPPPKALEPFLDPDKRVGGSGALWRAIEALCVRLAGPKGGEPPPTFLEEARHWYVDGRRKPTAAQTAAKALQSKRNRLRHDVPTTDEGADSSSLAELTRNAEILLTSLRWLMDFRIVALKVEGLEDGRAVGTARVFVGSEETAPRRTWSAPPIHDAKPVCLAHRTRGFLSLQDVAAWTSPGGGNRALYLWSEQTRRNGAPLWIDVQGTQTEAATLGVGATVAARAAERPLRRLLMRIPDGEAIGAELGEPPDTLLLPHIPRGFRVKALLGRGGMAEVLDAVEIRTGEAVALKVVRLDVDAGRRRQFRERLELEGQILEELGGVAGIVRGFRRDSRDGRWPAVRMKRMNAGLDDLLGRPPQDPRTLSTWLRELLQTLESVHAAGVVHRDVKPSNLLFDSSDQLRLADFGIAWSSTLSGGLTEVGSDPPGTPGYVPLWGPAAQYDGKRDVFATGIVLLQLLTAGGKRKKPGVPDRDKLLDQARKARPSDPDWVRLVDVAEAMTPSDPTRAINATEALRRLDERAAPAPPPEPEDDEPATELVSPTTAGGAATASAGARIAPWIRRAADDSAAQSIPMLTELFGALPAGVEDALRLLARRRDRLQWHHRLGAFTLEQLVSDLDLPLSRGTLLRAAAAQGIVGDEAPWDQLASLPANRLGLPTLIEALGQDGPPSLPEKDVLLAVLAGMPGTPRLRYVTRQVEAADDGDDLTAFWGRLGSLPSSYRKEARRKPGGGVRWLHCPDDRLKTIQTSLARMLSALPLPHHATGFVPHRSTALNARYHRGAREAVVVDIAGFFGAVYPRHLAPALRRGRHAHTVGRTGFLAATKPFERWSEAGKDALVQLLFHHDVDRRSTCLPEGAPTSPVAANFAAAPLDELLQANLRSRLRGVPFAYSRYADDLVVSSPAPSRRFREIAEQEILRALALFGWRPATKKTRRWRRRSDGPALTVCGVSVASGWTWGTPDVPRSTRRRLRAALHRIAAIRRGAETEGLDPALGLVSYVHGITAETRLAPLASRTCRAAVGVLAAHFAPGDEAEFCRAWVDAGEPRQAPVGTVAEDWQTRWVKALWGHADVPF